jgi:hypothetical protein
MRNRLILVGTCVSLAVLIGCGDDDDTDKDAGTDGGDDASIDSGPEGGNGGTGGKSGTGGKGGTGGKAGSGEAGASGEGGAGSSGEGGAGGSGGSGGNGSTYRISGEVSGLTGTGLVLQNNDGDDLSVSDSGDFEFATKLATGADYAVTVKTQPSNPTQNCTVNEGSGEVGSEDVDDVAVVCSTSKFTVGGTLSGLTGAGLKLRNNGGDELDASGATFTFVTSLDSGASYAVTIQAQPAGQTCGVASASGQVGSGNVTSVAVTCYANPVLLVEPRFASAIATWNDTSATSHTLKGTTSSTCDVATMSCPGAVEVANATSPATVPNLTDGTVYYFQLIAAHSGDVTALSNKTATRPNKPKFDGNVSVLLTNSGTTYAGGSFTRLSVHTGGAVPVSKTTGLPSEIPNFPIVDGDVYVVAPDASGGYYLGGEFQSVDGQARTRLAHVLSTGVVDPNWTPTADSTVKTIALNNSKVYIAGGFANVASNGGTGSAARAGLAAIGVDGNLVTTWNPNPNATSTVSAIAFWNNNVIVGGSFTNIGGQARLVMLDGTSGMLQPWNPAPDVDVNALAVNGDVVYVGGEFDNIGMAARSNLAAINLNGTDVAKATSWDPSPDNSVTSIAFAANTLYIAGLFQNVGNGTPAARPGIAALDPAGAGAVKEWNPTVAPSNSVFALAASADTVYIAGTLSSVNGMGRDGVAAISGSGTGTPTSWNPNPDGNVASIALVGESVVLGGQLRGIYGVSRPHVAAFDSNGKVTTWTANVEGDAVRALALSGTTLYVGGDFTTIGGMTRNFAGAVDTTTGTPTGWDPDGDGPVYALAISGSTVYAGGSFSEIGGLGRANIAALDSAGDAVTAWDAPADSAVNALALQGNTLYVGGDFTTLDSASRNRLGALDASGNATTWNPNIAGTAVYAIAATADVVYAGGDFTTVNAQTRPRLVAVPTAVPNDPSMLMPTGWTPTPDGVVYALLLADSRLYAGGDFTQFGTVLPLDNRTRYAAFGSLDPTPALETDPEFIQNFSQPIRALSSGGSGVIFAGGDFQAVGGEFTSSFVRLTP